MSVRALLDEVVRDEPPLAVDASAAWAAGRARRTRRLPRVLAAAAAVLGLLALVVPAVPLPGTGVAAAPVAAGYPSRLEQPWSLDPMPERPGALAALVHWPERTWSLRLSWLAPRDQQVEGDQNLLQAVSPTGEVWLAPRELREASLSPDGRWLVGLRESDGVLVVRDLVAGTRREVEGVAGQRARVPGAAALPEVSPPRWSPDSRAVAFYAGHALVVDVVDGTFRRVLPAGRFVGWRSPVELVFLDGETQEAVTTDLSGGERSRVRLAGLPAPDARLTQEAMVAGDGRTLVVPDGFGLRWHDLTDGALRQTARYPAEEGGGVCGLGPYAVDGSPDVVVTTLDAAGERALVVRLGPEAGAAVVAQAQPVTCPVWSARALAGAPVEDGGLPLLLEALVAACVLALAVVVLTRLAHRRT